MRVKLFYGLSILMLLSLFLISCEESNTPIDDEDPPVDEGSFKFVQYDSTYSGSETFVVLYGDIFSLTDVDQEISVTRVARSIPSAWSSSFCIGPACLPPFLDRFTFTLSAGDTALFSLDTYPNGELGLGSWTIFAVDSSTMEIDSVNISMEIIGAP